MVNLNGRSTFTYVLLTWDPPQQPNGVIIAYEVTYRIHGSDLVTLNITYMSITIGGLEPKTIISNISVSAYNRIGQGQVEALPSLITLAAPCEDFDRY